MTHRRDRPPDGRLDSPGRMLAAPWPYIFAVCATLMMAMPGLGATEPFGLETPRVALSGLPLTLEISIPDTAPEKGRDVRIFIDDSAVLSRGIEAGVSEITVETRGLDWGRHTLSLISGDTRIDSGFRVIPAWLSIVPPLIAIILALITKEVLISLFCGVFAGSLFLFDWNPFIALARVVDRYVVPSVANPDQAAILVFTLLLGGMVALISRSGGTLGIVDRLRGFASSASRGQLSSWVLGVLIFFDDYSNILIVGSTMRPITDRLRISREKLAYIVDSTAAPIASLFPISSWIGFEVGLIAAAFATLGIQQSAYLTFVASIPYRFYPIFALVLGFTIAVSGRDFGPMLKAERRSRKSGKVLDDAAVPLADLNNEHLIPPESAPKRSRNAILPIFAVVVVTIGGMIVSGSEGLERSDFSSSGSWLREVFGNANSYQALCWASLTGLVLAFALALAQRLFSIREGVAAMVEGFKSVLMALVVLILAWSIGSICGDMQTTQYLVSLTAGVVSPHLLPVLVFILSAVVAFATGSSWGTLGILTPLVIPLAHSLSIDSGILAESSQYATILVGTISSVLAGSVWGDHCSPISDTTILSSMASGSDHIAHVRTQLPYALTAGIVGMLIGDIPTAYGLSPWVSLLVGSAILISLVFWIGRRSESNLQPKP